jgi:hypothetical protein
MTTTILTLWVIASIPTGLFLVALVHGGTND